MRGHKLQDLAPLFRPEAILRLTTEVQGAHRIATRDRTILATESSSVTNATAQGISS
jgi:hypothetical protein